MHLAEQVARLVEPVGALKQHGPVHPRLAQHAHVGRSLGDQRQGALDRRVGQPAALEELGLRLH
jgi:hypothetical protein